MAGSRRKRAKPPCIVCGDVHHARGLCRNCYQNATYAIRTGKATEAELIEAGLMLPKRQGPESDFRSELVRWLERSAQKRGGEGCRNTASA